MIKISNLSFIYPGTKKQIVHSFDFAAEKGEIIHVSGKSGSGKTTLLNLICGVIPKIIKGDMDGIIEVDDQNIEHLSLPEIGTHISLLMQDPDLQLFFPTVEQELAFGPENMKIEPPEIKKKISESLEIFNIEHLRNNETYALSFGEKKLVAFAGLLTLNPNHFLLDEPFAGLSPKQIKNVENAIKQLSNQGKTIFIAEHQDLNADFATKQIVMEEIAK